MVPTAEKSRRAFRQSCSIRCEIRAAPERIWALLTDATRFPSWNSTVTSIEGEIALGNRLALKVPLDPKRTFHPRVTELVPNQRMVWRDGFAPMFRGTRTFTLMPGAPGVTQFAMTEVLSGLMLPMIRGSLPDFGPAFETYAADLTRAAEANPRSPQ
jgi:uncharacterized protein YndB with AHSA1/START domain